MFQCRIRKQASDRWVAVYIHQRRASKSTQGLGLRKWEHRQRRLRLYLDWYWVGERRFLRELFYS